MVDKSAAVKPPIGLVPKHIAKYNRLIEVKKAILRYMDADLKVSQLWIKEYNELLDD